MAVAISLALATFAGQAGAATKTWNNSLCNWWTVAGCWTPAGVPTGADGVVIAPVAGNSSTVYIDTYTQGALGGDAVANSLTIDSTVLGRTAALAQSGSALVTVTEFIGLSGTGSFSQSGGSHTVGFAMYLGSYGSSSGRYDLSGGSLTTKYELLGLNSGTVGTFQQTGGSHTVTGSTTLGSSAGSRANYYLDAGSLTNNLLTVGESGSGNVAQTGGSHVATNVAFGTLSGVGYYSLSGGTLNVSGAITTGTGSGALNVDGGTLKVDSGNIAVTEFNVGVGFGRTGSHVQTNGLISATSMTLGGDETASGAYQLNGGSLTTVSENISILGRASFSQLAGSNTVTGDLAFGKFLRGKGTYTLSGGTLEVGGAITTGAGSGTLNLDGGLLTLGSGNIGVTNLNLGSVAGSSGSHVQTLGTVSVGNLALGTAGSTASYTLAGGVLNIATSLTGAGRSTLNLDGGNFTALSGATLVDLALGSTVGSAFTLNIANVGGVNTFAALSAASETIGGLGAGHMLQTGGSNTVGTLTINDTYTYNGGSLVVTSSLNNNGAFQLGGTTFSNAGSTENNGTLSGYGRISSGGAFANNGLVSQSGGHLTLSGAGSFTNNGNWDLQSGYQLKLDGSSFENAGVLNLNSAQVTGSGAFSNAIGGTVAGRGTIATTFANAGTLALADGATTVSKGFVNSGVILIGGNTAVLNGGALINTGLIQGYGKVASAVTNTGGIRASGGTLTLTQAMSNGGNLVADNASTLLFQGGLAANNGNIRINGGALDNTGYTLSNSGQIQASTGAGQIHGGITGLAGSQLIVSGGGSLTLYDPVEIQTGAELRVSSGATATFFGQVFQRTGSLFTGAGTKHYEGGLSVGASPGLGVDAGDVGFGAGNLYLAEIGGTSACTAACATDEALKNSGFDKYVVAGHLALGGTLKLVSWDGFVAQAGQSFDLLDWGSVSGSFGNIDASGLMLAAGTQLDTSRLYADGVIGISAVPEPGTLASMLAGLCGLIWLSRHRGPGQLRRAGLVQGRGLATARPV
jgi:hypothetical protein